MYIYILQDVLTDLNAEGEQLPITPPIEDWFGHKGFTIVLKIKLNLFERSFLQYVFYFQAWCKLLNTFLKNCKGTSFSSKHSTVIPKGAPMAIS